MSTRQWDPFAEMMSMRQMMARMYAEGFGRPPLIPGKRHAQTLSPVDVYETGDAYIVKAPLPGARAEDVRMSCAGRILSIRVAVKGEAQVVPDRYLYRERAFGSFTREVELPAPVLVDKAEARVDNGVLSLSLPKSEAARPRHIQVRKE
ncbi:MAG: Hsp20/alpha crystallin family protein [Chloroflexota bacterium]